MDLTLLFSVIVVVAGAITTMATLLPRLAKIKAVGEGGKAFGASLAASSSPTDDTPGRITPSEWAEAIEAGAKAVKENVKDM